MIKSVMHDVCALLIENFKVIFKEEIKEEVDKRVNSEKHMVQQQITSLEQVNLLVIQIDLEEFKQYGRCLSLWIDGVPVRRRKEARMFLNMLRLCLKKQILGMLMDILIEPIELVNLTLVKRLQKM